MSSTAAEFNAQAIADGKIGVDQVDYLIGVARSSGFVSNDELMLLEQGARIVQRRAGLDVDGKVGRDTLGVVNSALGRAAPARADGPVIDRLPLYVPDWPEWEPADPDGDGVDKNWRGRDCPGFGAAAAGERSHVVTLGGGFDAARSGGLHRALDWMCPSGVIVRTPADVELVSWRNGSSLVPGVAHTPKGGHCMRMRDARRWEHYFGHMLREPHRLEILEEGGRTRVVETLKLKTGDVLPKGAYVGFVGRTGNAVNTAPSGKKTGCPHLHESISAPSVAAARAFGRAHGIDYAGVKVDVVAVYRELFAAKDFLRR